MKIKKAQTQNIVDSNKLKALRVKSGLTQAQVSEYLGYKTPLGYHYLESGRCRIKLEQAVKLSQLYNVDLSYIISKSVTNIQASA
jgi:putative transcriptional regulator